MMPFAVRDILSHDRERRGTSWARVILGFRAAVLRIGADCDPSKRCLAAPAHRRRWPGPAPSAPLLRRRARCRRLPPRRYHVARRAARARRNPHRRSGGGGDHRRRPGQRGRARSAPWRRSGTRQTDRGGTGADWGFRGERLPRRTGPGGGGGVPPAGGAPSALLGRGVPSGGGLPGAPRGAGSPVGWGRVYRAGGSEWCWKGRIGLSAGDRPSPRRLDPGLP